jgi:hypothetical protein
LSFAVWISEAMVAQLSAPPSEPANRWFSSPAIPTLSPKIELNFGFTKRGYGAVLTRADLRKANPRGAGLRDARLDEADLRGARLGSAFLVGASIRGADLRGAYLRLAKLDGADLSDARLEAVEGLKPAQLNRAQLNPRTRLPGGLIGAENAER